MNRLLIWRHAKAEVAKAGQSDRDRSLSPRGIDDAHRVATLLVEEGLVPELIICSNATRTLETVEELQSVVRGGIPQINLVELYLADVPDYLDALAAYAADVESVMIVGHNPTVESFLSDVTRDARAPHVRPGQLCVYSRGKRSWARPLVSELSLETILEP